MSTTILIADDHQILRQGLKLLLEKNGDRKVIAQSSEGNQTVEMTLELKPNIVIMDINMPKTDGINATRKIVSKLPDTKVIALSMHQKKRYITEILKAGASGYVLKEKAFSELVTAIEAVLGGQVYLCPMSSKIMLDDYVKNACFVDPSHGLLSEKDIELIKYLSDGLTSKDIAGKMDISPKTVDANRRKIMKKLDIDNIPDLVKFSIREGYTNLD